MSCPNTQQWNRVAKRKNRQIIETVHSFLIDASMLVYFWVEVAHVAVFTINRLPCSVLSNKTPFEVLFYRLPDYAFLKPFGCSFFSNMMASSTNKLHSQSVHCVFLGYTAHYKGYCCTFS